MSLGDYGNEMMSSDLFHSESSDAFRDMVRSLDNCVRILEDINVNLIGSLSDPNDYFKRVNGELVRISGERNILTVANAVHLNQLLQTLNGTKPKILVHFFTTVDNCNTLIKTHYRHFVMLRDDLQRAESYIQGVKHIYSKEAMSVPTRAKARHTYTSLVGLLETVTRNNDTASLTVPANYYYDVSNFITDCDVERFPVLVEHLQIIGIAKKSLLKILGTWFPRWLMNQEDFKRERDRERELNDRLKSLLSYAVRYTGPRNLRVEEHSFVGTSVKLSWVGIGSTDGYPHQFYFQVNGRELEFGPIEPEFTAVRSGYKYRYQLTNLETNTTYNVNVSAKTDLGSTLTSKEIKFTTKLMRVQLTPLAITHTSIGMKFDIETQGRQPEIRSYTVKYREINDNNDTEFNELGYDTPNEAISIRSLQPDTEYEIFAVVQVASEELQTKYRILRTLQEPPIEPRAYDVTDTSIRISWNKWWDEWEGEPQCRLEYRSKDGSHWQHSRDIRGGQRSFVLNGLQYDTEYDIVLMDVKTSRQSRTIQTRTDRAATIGIGTPEPSDHTIKFNIIVNGMAGTGFEVCYQEKGKNADEMKAEINLEKNRDCVIDGLSPLTSYDIQVFAKAPYQEIQSRKFTLKTLDINTTLIASARVDTTGGILGQEDGGTSIVVPPNSVSDEETLFTTLVYCDDPTSRPELSPGQTMASAPIDFGIEGGALKGTVGLAIEVNLTGRGTTDVYYTPSKGGGQPERISEKWDISYTVVKDVNKVIVHTKESGIYSIVESIPETSQMKSMKLIFFLAYRANGTIIVRNYLVGDTADAEQAVNSHVRNSTIAMFKRSDVHKYNINQNKGDLRLSLSKFQEKYWKPTSELTQLFDYFTAWKYGKLQYREFVFQRKNVAVQSKKQIVFSCTEEFHQEKREGKPLQIRVRSNEVFPVKYVPVKSYSPSPFDQTAYKTLLNSLKDGWRDFARQLGLDTREIKHMAQKNTLGTQRHSIRQLMNIWTIREGKITVGSYGRLYDTLADLGLRESADVVKKAEKNYNDTRDEQFR